MGSIINLANGNELENDTVIFGDREIIHSAKLSNKIVGDYAGVLNCSASEALVFRHMTKAERKEHNLQGKKGQVISKINFVKAF